MERSAAVESSIFPIANFALRFFPLYSPFPSPSSPSRRSPTWSHRQCVPTVNHRRLTTTPGNAGSRVSPSGHAPPRSTPPPLTPTSHSFLRSSRRYGLALFFLSSTHNYARRSHSPFTTPTSCPLATRFPLNHHLLLRLHLARPDRSNQWHCRHNKNGKKAAAAHTFRAVTLSLTLSLFLSCTAFSLPLSYLQASMGWRYRTLLRSYS